MGTGFKLEESKFRLDIFNICLYMYGCILEHFVQRVCGCPIPGIFQGQIEWVLSQPDLLVGAPANGREVRTR